MVYTYNQVNYTWFRVTVNGSKIADEDGIFYPRPGTPSSDPFVEFQYDLTPYQGDADFILGIESCAKYNPGYTTTYPWGDCSYIDDLEIYYELEPGDIEGYVFNYDGLAISGATIAHEDGANTVSGPDGHYLLEDIQNGDQLFYAGKTGYNTTEAMVNIPSGGTANYDFTLTQPNMVINPLYIEETLNPGEFFTTSLNVLNNGTGPLGWEAMVVYPEIDNAAGGNEINPVLIEEVEPNGDASIGYGEMTGDGNRDLMVCPDNSLFSIPPVGFNQCLYQHRFRRLQMLPELWRCVRRNFYGYFLECFCRLFDSNCPG